ncbi:hypothetical protein DFJ74DRAFT_694731 [Hyaloraphidium curvatum]|nr:hypothetical protein DFJ74DRAFT_694731 [Hyaloraphidium curvatum]
MEWRSRDQSARRAKHLRYFADLLSTATTLRVLKLDAVTMSGDWSSVELPASVEHVVVRSVIPFENYRFPTWHSVLGTLARSNTLRSWEARFLWKLDGAVFLRELPGLASKLDVVELTAHEASGTRIWGLGRDFAPREIRISGYGADLRRSIPPQVAQSLQRVVVTGPNALPEGIPELVIENLPAIEFLWGGDMDDMVRSAGRTTLHCEAAFFRSADERARAVERIRALGARVIIS